MKTGYYFLYVVEADSDTVKEFNRVSGITAMEKDATAVLLPVYLNSGSLVSRPIKNTLFIIFPHFLSYDDQDGKKRYVTEVIADNVEFLGSKGQSSSASTST